MSSPVPDLPATCPACGATVRQSVPWCLQCYADLRPAPAEPLEPTLPPEPPAPHASDAASGGEAADRPVTRRGRHAAQPEEPGPGAPSDPEHLAALADRMLAELAGEEAGAGEGSSTTRLAARFAGNKGATAAWTVGAAVLLVAALVVVLTVLGHLV